MSWKPPSWVIAAVRLLGVVLVLIPVSMLSGCSDPVRVGLTGDSHRPTALIDPCRKNWHEWQMVEWIDTANDRILWKTSTDKVVDVQKIIYGVTPLGMTSITAPSDLEGVTQVQIVYSSKVVPETTAATFDLKHVSTSDVLLPAANDETVALSDWSASCN